MMETFIELARSVRTGEILVSFFFAGFWGIKQKKNSTNIFPVGTSRSGASGEHSTSRT